MSIYCPQCGAENKDTARFCRGCGRTLSAASGPNPPPVAAAGTPAYGSSRQSPPTPAGPAAWSGVGRTGLLAPNFIVNNRYLITRKVGHGGMAAVYDAVDNHTSRRVALKEMSDSAITNPADRMTALAQFRQEAQLLATLDHPNLPKVSDVF